MATITIRLETIDAVKFLDEKSTVFRGIGKVEGNSGSFVGGKWNISLTIHRMSETRFENVVKRVLTKNLTEQGITPLSIEYSE